MRTGRKFAYNRREDLPGLYSDDVRDALGPSRHFTVLYTTFVFMQLFNQINCRKLTDELNIFSGLLRNRIALGIFIAEAGLQAIITEFGRDVFSLSYKVSRLNISFRGSRGSNGSSASPLPLAPGL